MSERFYYQRDNLTVGHRPVPPAQRRPKGTIPTYYELLKKKKEEKK